MSNHRTFVVRIWHEPSAKGAVWRASATDVHSQEKHHFTTRDELKEFLEQSHTFQPNLHKNLAASTKIPE
jgi:hypothetical protein